MGSLSQNNSRIFRGSVFAGVFLCSMQAAASDDAYLKMLEGEAEDLKLDQSGQLKQAESVEETTDTVTKTDWKWEGDLTADTMPAGLAQDEFSSVLKQNYYGTFVFYRKLNSVDQQTVYYHYTKSAKPDLDSIREHILSLLKK